MSFVSSKPDPYPTPVDVVVYLISAIMNRVIKRFYCTKRPVNRIVLQVRINIILYSRSRANGEI